MSYDLSDLESLVLIRIIPMGRTLGTWTSYKERWLNFFFVSGKPPWNNSVNHDSQLKSVTVCPAFLLMSVLFSLGVLLSRTHLEYKTLWDWPVKMNRHSGRVGCFSRPPTHPSLFPFPSTTFSCLMLVVQQTTVTSQFFLFVMAKTHVDRVWDRVGKQLRNNFILGSILAVPHVYIPVFCVWSVSVTDLVKDNSMLVFQRGRLFLGHSVKRVYDFHENNSVCARIH